MQTWRAASRSAWALAVFAVAAWMTGVLARAQDPSAGPGQAFPAKAVRLVVAFPPGGPLDISGRIIGKELQELLGQPVVIENKPGSTIGPEYVVKSAPDGFTLMIISSTPLVTLSAPAKSALRRAQGSGRGDPEEAVDVRALRPSRLRHPLDSGADRTGAQGARSS